MSATAVFTTLESVLKKDGESVVKSVNGIYQFVINTASGAVTWAVDLKNGAGSIKNEKHAKPDCTITMSESDFVDLMAGKLNGQTAFMQKKLKISGNMALAMKLNNIVKKIKEAEKSAPAAATPATTTPAAPAAAAAGLADGTPVGKIFDDLSKTVGTRPQLVKSINGIYQFNITGSGAPKTYTVDLKNAPGAVKSGAPAKADCTITIKDTDFLDLFSGKVNGQVLFGQGKLKIQGNMGLAMKLGQITKPASKL
ncbi:P11915 Nonspecific lipid-transfer protein [Heterostelium album PN500]|uniref:P11915 Nonspecific lipid-transfer protein n=1 Tax=Heterostelium pallidum (strain ATCC 26659 / Pp 5 / PN500) TaxID=670386 RepID=D3B7K7_HETP5|nr:P11915 Nonspecific lipid-transfer protein [Heterostelium album PN500]EFA82750.1 P11915 Nonspecific lipid-transfer protein [Heterostelium album PN500]|eukprot:XP_020434867.1 P11915 Nonspecific lipid-transfer protein [Heterostelium album PN500]